ncbi:MAG: toxin-antitoxin system YwqK family antitoxin [Opitutaceae bacterium]|nr:toxin-antitoxin system YwqK family antitoxin [Verrucomicrobiales bacterium]
MRDGSIRLRLLALAASLAAVVCFLLIQRPAWFFPSTASITRLPSAGTSELSLREGRLYRAGETVGFTGLMLETYEGGVQKSRTSISNGLIHGLSEGWHTNGQLQVSEVFKEGKSHGIRTKYYSNGTNLSQATIVDGRIEGQFRRWHENGRLAEQIDMKDGVPHGVSLTYFPSGYLRAQTVLSNGATVTQKFWRDGQVKESPATTR